MKTGFIGTGVMGSRMAETLLRNGFEVQVFNRTRNKAKALEERGAIIADSVPELAGNCDVICTCLSMPSDVIEVYTNPSGILEHAQPGAICVDFTSVGADTSRKVHEQAVSKGVFYLDAPVSGGPEGAESGSLTIMAGGEREAFHKVLPLLSVLGKTVEHLGPSGSGSIAKLLNQYLVAVHSLAASEAMVAGAASGLAPEQLFHVLKASYGDSKILRRHMDEYVFDRDFQPGGAVKYVHKDVRLANQLLEGAGMGSFTGQMAEQAFQKASEQGMGDLDMSAVIIPLEKKCKVEVKGK
ncbi:3-hydroxyisobutyrate dehydrogenase [Mesobacillus campisalis]|uniref:3-hydroxyisobutyrate dehydrogenase n=1 Tax=Mesobacillus campisalis TaxID=1408103 RepID=A0A0M2SUN7_9BACI|nr:NAD(P)-dependent oxidoreductase [Mesobacillus campisalis]KKK37416.1 3-hydroxyisobutyrate dehydrogenase [Mesobacillus campisalis]